MEIGEEKLEPEQEPEARSPLPIPTSLLLGGTNSTERGFRVFVLTFTEEVTIPISNAKLYFLGYFTSMIYAGMLLKLLILRGLLLLDRFFSFQGLIIEELNRTVTSKCCGRMRLFEYYVSIL